MLRVERRAGDHSGRALPAREHSRAPKAQATLDFDEHGIPFCRHCRGGTDQVNFVLVPAEGPKSRPRPILRVRCAAPEDKKCEGVKEWNCQHDPTRLLPVWRTHPAYVYAIIAWLKASVINGWLGTPSSTPELEQDARRHHQLDRRNKHTFSNHMTVLNRLRLGHVRGGRLPTGTRGAPTRRSTPTKS